jgi:hypothetical protein
MPVLRGTVLALTNGVGLEGNLIKRAFLTSMLLCFFVLGTDGAQAQVYAPGYYDQSWSETESYSEQYDPYQELEAMHYNQFYPQQYDPYYDLQVMHYKLNWPQFQTYLMYPYQPYIYPPCCVPAGY